MELSHSGLCELIPPPRCINWGLGVQYLTVSLRLYKVFQSVRLSEWLLLQSDTVLIRENEGTRASAHKGVAICKRNGIKVTILWCFLLPFPPEQQENT